MKLCEKCLMLKRYQPPEASYSVTLTGCPRDLDLCGPCMNEESVQGKVVRYTVKVEAFVGFTPLFYIIMLLLFVIIGVLSWMVWYG